MSKVHQLSLSNRDKTPALSGYGYDFHHTDPQRRVPCVLGDMLAPLSADDIPPIAPEAMASVQAALTLLANLVGDQDHGRYLGCGEARLEKYRENARDILSVARGLAGILRVVATTTADELSSRDAPATPPPDAPAPPGHAAAATPPTMLLTISPPPTTDLCMALSAVEITALTMAREHVRVSMAHSYSWASRDTALVAIGKVLTTAAKREVRVTATPGEKL